MLMTKTTLDPIDFIAFTKKKKYFLVLCTLDILIKIDVLILN